MLAFFHQVGFFLGTTIRNIMNDENTFNLILSLCKTIGNVGDYLEENQKRRKDDKEAPKETPTAMLELQPEQEKSAKRKKRRISVPTISDEIATVSGIDKQKAKKILATWSMN